MDVYRTRRDNLRRIVGEWGGPTSLAKKLGHSNGSYLAQLIGPNPSREVSEKVAREIEGKLQLPTGWPDGKPDLISRAFCCALVLACATVQSSVAQCSRQLESSMSRKIEDQMIAAIRAGKSMKSGNTEVVQPTDGATEVRLHGNPIIRYVPTKGWEWSLAAWNTATTRSRINAAVRGLNWDVGVCQKAGAPQAVKLGQMTPVADDEWIRVF